MMDSECGVALPILIDGALSLGLTLAETHRQTFEHYCGLLLRVNEQMNLTAIREPQGVMRTLFLDSLTVTLALPDALRSPNMERAPKVIDVGSGAGLPGLPLKIVHEWWHVALLESIGKKARFLEMLARELQLENVDVLASRAEEVARNECWRGAADACVARAVAPLATLIELCAPLVRQGGTLLFPKSGDVFAEIRQAAIAARKLRITLQRSVEVPPGLGLGANRFIVVYEKVGKTPSDYPRRDGLPRSRPLGLPSSPRAPARPRSAR